MEKLREHRTQKGYSHKVMAEHLGISKTYYWQIENDVRRLSYVMAIKISEVFKMKPDDLFYDELKKNKD